VKKIELRESKTVLQVRKIKEEMAREAEKDPKYYQSLNGLGAKLLKSSHTRRNSNAKQSRRRN
jgi:hypothetical protein